MAVCDICGRKIGMSETSVCIKMLCCVITVMLENN